MLLPSSWRRSYGVESRSGRFTVPLALLLVAGLVALLLVLRFAGGSPPPARAGETVVKSAAANEVTPAARVPDGDLAIVDRPDDGTAERQEAAPMRSSEAADTGDALAAPGRTTIIAGRVVFHGDAGAASQAPSGEGEALVWSKTSGRTVPFTILQGLFEVQLFEDSEGGLSLQEGGRAIGTEDEISNVDLKVLSLVGYGTVVACDPDSLEPLEEMTVPSGTLDAVIHVKAASRLTLNVLDASTGAHLAGVEVVKLTGWDAEYPEGADYRSLLAQQDVGQSQSPVIVTPDADDATSHRATCFVRAAGYGWRELTVDFAAGGERTVELAVAGGVEITAMGVVPGAARLRLSKVSNSLPLIEAKIPKSGGLRYESLDPGDYSARVGLGEWFSEERVLAMETFTVEPGTMAQVNLEVEPVEKAQFATVTGILIIPPEWDLPPNEVRLKFERLTASLVGSDDYHSIRSDKLQPVVGSPGHYRFEWKSVEVGSYVASAGTSEFKVPFEVPPEGVPDLLVEIPPPVTVSIQTVDSVTLQPLLSITQIHWHPKWPAGAFGGSLESVDRDATSGLFKCRVPRGEIELSPSDSGFSGHLVVDARDGAHFDFPIQENPTAWVVMTSGDTPVPFPDDYDWTIEAVDHDGLSHTSGSGPDGYWFGVTIPGLYRVVMPALDGFEPIEPLEVHLKAGPRQTVTFELVQK